MAEENEILQKTKKKIGIPEAVLTKTVAAANQVKDYTVSAANHVTSRVLSSSMPIEVLTKTSVIFRNIKDYTLTATSKGLLILKDVKSGKWILRFDGPHKTHTFYPHINTNPRLTKLPDPHIPISNSTFTASKGIAKIVGVLETAGKYALIVAVTVDGVRLGYAIYKDYINGKFESFELTVKEGSSILASWTGGYVFGSLGSISGAKVGGLVGAVFGGAAALPGAGKF